jgi:hypothetical protein
MRDDDLVSRLADLAREDEAAARRRLDPRWDRLAAGTLPPEEAAALAAEAGASAEGAAAREAFAPLGNEFRERVVAAVRGEVQAAEREKKDPGEVRGPAPLGEARRGRRPAPEDAGARARRRGRRQVLAGSAAAAAGLAAAVVLAVLRPWAAVEPLPPYSLTVSGATEQWRGEAPPESAATPQRFAPGNRLELVLTPQAAVEGRPEVAAYLARDGALTLWPVAAEVSEHGAVRIAGTVGEDLPLPAGESRLAVAVARRGALPGEAAVARALREWRGASPGCLPLAEDAWLCVADLVFPRDS